MQTGTDGNGMLWLADFSTLDKYNKTRVKAWCQFIPSFQSCLQSRTYSPFPHVSNSLLCSSWGSDEASGHIPGQGMVLHLTLLQCTVQELLKLLTAEAESTWPSKDFRMHLQHTHGNLQVSSLLTHLQMNRGTEQGKMGHREWTGETMVMMCNQHSARKSTCPSVFVSHPILIASYWNVLFSSPKTYPFSACHISMLTV